MAGKRDANKLDRKYGRNFHEAVRIKSTIQKINKKVDVFFAISVQKKAGFRRSTKMVTVFFSGMSTYFSI